MLLCFVASMSVRKLINAFFEWRQSGEAMVLATVYETAGSTYSKAGHRMLIAGNGDYQGLVSGGCLEGDLAEHAAKVLETRRAMSVTYDLRDEADDLFGLGIGCNGLIRVLLQPLEPEHGFEPFASISKLALRGAKAVVATVVEHGKHSEPPGATAIWETDAGLKQCTGSPLLPDIASTCEQVCSSGAAVYRLGEDGRGILFAPVRIVPRLLVLGAGLDAIPVVRIAVELGWKVTVCDHRPAYLERGGFELADAVQQVDPRRLPEQVAVADFEAILVMSHHLRTDAAYLTALGAMPVPYLGVLGPPARREKLLSELGALGEELRPRLRGPVGIDLCADSAESIALSIVAELYMQIQSHRRPRG